jgi:hypothetical protein
MNPPGFAAHKEDKFEINAAPAAAPCSYGQNFTEHCDTGTSGTFTIS